MKPRCYGEALPLAVTIVREGIYRSFLAETRNRMLFHGHSFTGNPISCVAAVASIKIFSREQTLKKLKNIEVHHKKAIDFIKKTIDCADTRLCGTMAAIELGGDKEGYLSERLSKLTVSAMERGLFLRTLGNVIYLLPPYCATDEDLNFAWEVLGSELKKISI